MPWSIKVQDGKHCVIKDADGSVEKCHATEAEAKDHMAALYASEGKELEPDQKAQGEPGPAEVVQARSPANTVTINIGRDVDEAGLFERFKDWLKAAPMKTVDGQKYPASDFLVVEDAQSPSTWHLQVKRNGKPDRGLAGAAWAALFSPGGHRGNKYAGPGKEAAGKKLRALYNSEGWELPGDNKETGMMLWKEADGSIRWLARYSNNRRDRDNPPEIISEQSHRRFDELLSKGLVDMPELWLWHRPEWKLGVATWHAYDDSGFPIAGGVVDKAAEPVVEQIMVLDPALVRVSHGMPTSSIVRDEADDSVIVEHITREISPLPAWAAANYLTGFISLKEATDMAIPQDKRDALKNEWNLSDELLSQLEAANAADAKEADEAGIESKEVQTAEATPVLDKAEETTPVETEGTEIAAVEEPEAPPEPGISRAEMQAALEAIGRAISSLSAQIKEVQGQVVEVKEQKSVEEALTLSELFERAIGHPDARVDGRTTAAKDRPAENRGMPLVVNSGNPLADSIVNQIVSGEFLAGLKGGQPTQ